MHSESEEMEVEQKFQDGMLTKMSKITDLISRLESLEGLDGVNGDDQKRIKKPRAYTIDCMFCIVAARAPMHVPWGCFNLPKLPPSPSGWLPPWRTRCRRRKKRMIPLWRRGCNWVRPRGPKRI